MIQTRRAWGRQWGRRGKDEFPYILDIESLGLVLDWIKGVRDREESSDAWFLVGHLDGQGHSLSRRASRCEEPWGRWYAQPQTGSM